MKKLFTMALAALMAVGVSAVPVKPGAVTVTQSDGTKITITPVGDEWHHGLLTSDGLTVAPREGSNDLYYRTRDGISTQRAHEVGDRQAAELSFLAVNKSYCTMQAQQSATSTAKRANAKAQRKAGQTPSLGSNRVPVILVQYKDIKFKSNNNLAAFKNQYETGDASVKQYFIDQSNGDYVPQYDVYGPYTLNNNRATYGGNDSQGNDKGVARMVGEAVDKAGSDIDWSVYDNDGDGQADVCIVVYAGVGEAQASYTVPNSVWPCQWSLSEGGRYGDGTGARTRNGVTIDKFAVFNELYGSSDNTTRMDGIGTFCHEFSHCLGLPDFYETTYNNGYFGMGPWSLMDSGCYNGDGDVPIGYGGYEKEFMGWIEYQIPVENHQYTLPILNQKNKSTDVVYKVTSPLNNNEYFVLENRAKQGWDRDIEDEGMMITHVTYVASRWADNSVNDKEMQLFTIIPADNKLTSATVDKDLYGETNHSLTDDSSPAATLNMKANGSLANTTGGADKMGQPLTEINLNSDRTVSFWYMKGEEPPLEVYAPVMGDATDIVEDGFTANWTDQTPAENVKSYTLKVEAMVYDSPARKASETGDNLNRTITGITDKSYTVTGLLDNTSYAVAVKAIYIDDTESEWSTTEVTTPLSQKPRIIVEPTELDFGTVEVGSDPVTKTVKVTAHNLTGVITIDPMNNGEELVVDAEELPATGGEFNVTFTPTEAGEYTAQISITEDEVDEVLVDVKAVVQIAHPQPEIVPTTEATEITPTSFVAHWNAVENAESYDLMLQYDEEVEGPDIPEEAFLIVETFDPETFDKEETVDIGMQLDEYMANPGWVGNTIYKMPEAIRIGKSKGTGFLTSPVVNFTSEEGFTVVLSLTTYANDSEVPFRISAANVDKDFIINGDTTIVVTFDPVPGYADYKVKFATTTNRKRVVVDLITILDGHYDVEIEDLFLDEQADAPRHIVITNEYTYEGLTENFLTITDLIPATTYTYAVRAHYIDGVEGQWSTPAVITLPAEPVGNKYDVNHDGAVDVGDVNTVLGDILATGGTTLDYDVNGDGHVDVGDVNAILDAILNATAANDGQD